MRRSSGVVTSLVVMVIVIGGFGVLLWRNADPAPTLRAVVPTQVEPTGDGNAWQDALRPGFGGVGTAPPTVAAPVQQYTPPAMPTASAPTSTPYTAGDIGSGDRYTLEPTGVPATPTPAATRVAQATDAPEVMQSRATPITTWQPPPLLPPISADPQGFDHYWFIRPVDSNANNRGLRHYPYGSDGQLVDSPSRIHHGIDMSNAVGTTVRAAGSGTVAYAWTEANPVFQNSSSYGRVVFIEHDFGWRGEPLYTLYAHLEVVLVEPGQRVEMGDPIGLIGGTGRTTGPHVHFEVRMGGDRYGDTYNPVLWVVPYVGHGTITGRLLDVRGNLEDDIDVTLRWVGTTLVEATTTTYIFDGTPNQVNADPNWQENFVFEDIPVGRYEVVAVLDGVRISRIVDVREGVTTFVELQPQPVATGEAVTPEP